MLTQTYLLLVDVKLLDVEYHLLLETALIRLSLKLGEAAQNFFSDCICAFLLELLDLLRELHDVRNLLGYILVEDLALL